MVGTLRSPGSALFSVVFSIILTLSSLIAPLGAQVEAATNDKNVSNTNYGMHHDHRDGDGGAIWTTDKDGRHSNHFTKGDSVYLKGHKFLDKANNDLAFKIWTKPPNENGEMKKEGTVNIDSEGNIPVQSIWEISDDTYKGEYKVEITDMNKSCNFRVWDSKPDRKKSDLDLKKFAPKIASPLDKVTDVVIIENKGKDSAKDKKLDFKICDADFVIPAQNPFSGTAFDSFEGPEKKDDCLVYKVSLKDIDAGEKLTLKFHYQVAKHTPDGTIITDFATVCRKTVEASTRIVVKKPECKVVKITLAPLVDTNIVGTKHTVTATVTNDKGEPKEGVKVNFRFFSSLDPDEKVNLGQSVTDENGKASLTIQGPSTPQTWTIVAFFETNDDKFCQIKTFSNNVTKHWVEAGRGGDGGVTPPVEELPRAGSVNTSLVLLLTSVLLMVSYMLRGYLYNKSETTRKNILNRLVEVEK